MKRLVTFGIFIAFASLVLAQSPPTTQRKTSKGKKILMAFFRAPREAGIHFRC